MQFDDDVTSLNSSILNSTQKSLMSKGRTPNTSGNKAKGKYYN